MHGGYSPSDTRHPTLLLLLFPEYRIPRVDFQAICNNIRHQLADSKASCRRVQAGPLLFDWKLVTQDLPARLG